MSPQVIRNKLIKFNEYLIQFKKFKGCSYNSFWKEHLKFERLFEILIMIATDIIFHTISLKNESPPTTYRTSFLKAGELEIITKDLAEKLALSVGMRNIIVHQYEEIDYDKIYQSIDELIDIFNRFFIEIESLNL
jgi:uncharacterized protein YutE (UPF0331/DUF86 family)